MKVAVLISGRGSNLKAIIEDTKKQPCPYTVNVVISDKECPGLAYAREEKIPLSVVNYKIHANKQEAEKSIDNILNMFDAELVVLAGFMKILSPHLIRIWKGKIINIHPSLLPAFPGLHTHERAIEAGVKFHGCTVHFVDSGVDTGPIIAQRCIPVWPRYTAGELADEVLKEEHEILPKVIRMFANNRVKLVNNKVAYYNSTDESL